MAESIAFEMGIATDAVTVTVTAGSVIIGVEVAVQADEAAAVQADLSTALASPATATALLTSDPTPPANVTMPSIAVTSITTLPSIEYPPPLPPLAPPSTPPSPPSTPPMNPMAQAAGLLFAEGGLSDDARTLILAAIGAGILILLLMGFAWWRRRRAKRQGGAGKGKGKKGSGGGGDDSVPRRQLSREVTHARRLSRQYEPQGAGDEAQWEWPSRDIKWGKKLGSGAFGSVMIAESAGLILAAKRMAIVDKDEREATVKMMRREALALRSLAHPNVTTLLGVVLDSPQYVAMLMELADYGSLRDAMDKKPTLLVDGPSVQNRIALHVAEGMAYLHSREPPMLHHDLKSANVLLFASDAKHAANGLDESNIHSVCAKLCDFGLATGLSTNAGTGQSVLQTSGGGLRGGTLAYFSPEAFDGHYVAASEVYAYAIILWELLTCRVPWERNEKTGRPHTVPSLLRAVCVDGERPELDDTIKDSVLGGLAERCWRSNPSVRPSFEQVCSHLELYRRQALKYSSDADEGEDAHAPAVAADEAKAARTAAALPPTSDAAANTTDDNARKLQYSFGRFHDPNKSHLADYNEAVKSFGPRKMGKGVNFQLGRPKEEVEEGEEEAKAAAEEEAPEEAEGATGSIFSTFTVDDKGGSTTAPAPAESSGGATDIEMGNEAKLQHSLAPNQLPFDPLRSHLMDYNDASKSFGPRKMVRIATPKDKDNTETASPSAAASATSTEHVALTLDKGGHEEEEEGTEVPTVSEESKLTQMSARAPLDGMMRSHLLDPSDPSKSFGPRKLGKGKATSTTTTTPTTLGSAASAAGQEVALELVEEGVVAGSAPPPPTWSEESKLTQMSARAPMDMMRSHLADYNDALKSFGPRFADNLARFSSSKATEGKNKDAAAAAPKAGGADVADTMYEL